MTTIEYICKNCKSDPFDKYSTDDEGYIYQFHIDAGHNVVEYKDHDNSLYLDSEIVEIEKNGNGNANTNARNITLHLISKENIVKSSIIQMLSEWQHYRHNLRSEDLKEIVDCIWQENNTFNKIKSIAYKLGREGKEIQFDKGQNHEISEWLKGRYYIKRIEVDGKLLFFNGNYYEKKSKELILREARKHLAISTKNDMNEILSYIEDTSELITFTDIEKDIHLKCLLNGIYNIQSGEFSTEFNSTHIILNQIPHNYKDKSSFNNLDKVVREIITNEKNTQSYYDFLSTCLHPYTGIDFQFGGVGQSGTGKSQLCDLVELTLGEDNISDAPIHSIACDPTIQVDVAYKMCNIDRDMSEADIKDTSLLKKWITQERFSNRRIYEGLGKFRPTARLMFMTNNLFEISKHDDAEAIYERTNLNDLERKIRGTEKEINNVIEKTSTPEELDGFITYLLKNATVIYQMQRIHYPMSSKEVEKVWNKHGNRIREFIKKWCVKGTDFATERVDVYDKWQSHALTKEFPSKGRDTFYQQFEEIVGIKAISSTKNGINGRYYIGIRLLSDQELGMKERDDISK